MEIANHNKEKSSSLLFACCWIVYMIVCMSKTNYTASIACVVRDGIFSKSQSGIISAAFYLTYGVSQFFGGNIADRFSPFKVLMLCLLGSVVTNFLLAFTTDFYCVLILWSLTGLIQFGVWPATARIVTGVLVPAHRKKAGVYITFALATGGILSYFIVTSVLEVFGWAGVFVMNTLLMILSVILWAFASRRTEALLMSDVIAVKKDNTVRKSDVKFFPLFISSGLFLVLIFAIAQAMLDNGVKSWIPTMIMESYEISPALASMQTAIIYACNIGGLYILTRVFSKMDNPVLVQTIYFAICLPLCALMLFVGKLPLWVVFAVLVISTTFTYSMTSISVRIAAAFNKFGYSATVSGIINAFLCFGIVAANGGYGIIAEALGWNAVTTVWVVSAAVAAIVGIPATLMWIKFIKEKVEER